MSFQNLIKKVQHSFIIIDEKKLCCIISELNISGDDLKKFGIVGKNIGIVLNKLLEDVISENCKNKREVLLKQALLYK